MEKIEYRVRPVTRYIVTRYTSGLDGSGSIETRGEYDNSLVAYEVGYALCKAEHDRLGWPSGDERIQYPSQDDAYPQPTAEMNELRKGRGVAGGQARSLTT